MSPSEEVEKNANAVTLPALCDRAADLLLSFSLPLYLTERGRPWLCGTGFIVRATSGYFLVSAAHVLDEAKEKGLFFYSAPQTPRFVRGPVLRSSDKRNRKIDPFDLAVVRLVDGAMPPYPAVEKHAVDISWLHPHRHPRSNRMYLIIGFPQSKSNALPGTKEVRVTAYKYRHRSIDDEDYIKLGLDSETQLAMKLDLKVGYNPDGTHRNFPRPQGMSGAPIFELYEDGEAGADASVFPLVAVGIEYRERHRILVGTDVEVALDMINKL
jgi:hypothetical protein